MRILWPSSDPLFVSEPLETTKSQIDLHRKRNPLKINIKRRWGKEKKKREKRYKKDFFFFFYYSDERTKRHLLSVTTIHLSQLEPHFAPKTRIFIILFIFSLLKIFFFFPLIFFFYTFIDIYIYLFKGKS